MSQATFFPVCSPNLAQKKKNAEQSHIALFTRWRERNLIALLSGLLSRRGLQTGSTACQVQYYYLYFTAYSWPHTRRARGVTRVPNVRCHGEREVRHLEYNWWAGRRNFSWGKGHLSASAVTWVLALLGIYQFPCTTVIVQNALLGCSWRTQRT